MKMKKFLVIGLAVALSACLVGCGEKDNNDVNNNNTDNQNQNQTQNPNENQGSNDVAGTATGDVSGDIVTIMNDGNVMVRAPYQDYIYSGDAMAFLGLSEEEYDTSVEEGVFFESMVSPSNQSYCLLKVKAGADAAALQQKIFENANPRKWVCMSAEYLTVLADDSYVMLAMGPKENCDAVKAEFAKLAGSDMKATLEQVVEEDFSDFPDELYSEDDLMLNGGTETVLSGEGTPVEVAPEV